MDKHNRGYQFPKERYIVLLSAFKNPTAHSYLTCFSNLGFYWGTFERQDYSVFGAKLQNKDELVQNFTFLTHQKDSLLKEMEAVKRHLDNLKASNVELKNRKQVIIYGMGQPALHTLHHRHHHFHNQKQAFQLQQFPAIQWCSFPASSQLTATPSSAMIAGNRSKMGPVILPDLNLSLEEAVNVEGYQPSDAMTMITSYSMNRAWASAQARKRRMHIYKAKNILRQR
uniref:Uncharacterized protein n=1 Tax=Kalanchoe fedtschenkoi TaxID=63787 RepID=A0A7N0U2X6_KALFE